MLEVFPLLDIAINKAKEFMDDPLYNFTEYQPIFMMAERKLKKVLK